MAVAVLKGLDNLKANDVIDGNTFRLADDQKA